MKNTIWLRNKNSFLLIFNLNHFQSTFNSQLRSIPNPDLLLDFIFKSSDEVKTDFRDSFSRAIFKYIFRFRRFDWVYLSTTKRQKSLFSEHESMPDKISSDKFRWGGKAAERRWVFAAFPRNGKYRQNFIFTSLSIDLNDTLGKHENCGDVKSIALLDTAKFAKAPVSAQIEFRVGLKIIAFNAIRIIAKLMVEYYW